MDHLLAFFLSLVILVVGAKAGAYVALRLRQPAVLGNLIVGVLLGPTVLNILGWNIFAGAHLEETYSMLAHLGVLFLMFMAGLEVELDAMTESGRAAGLAGVLGVLAPMLIVTPAMLAFGNDLTHSLFIGLVLSATSVSISAQTLMELNMLRDRVGSVLLGAAVIDDVLVILLLSIFTAVVAGGGGASGVVWVVVKMVAYLVLAVAIGWTLLPRFVQWVDDLPISQSLTSGVLVVMLLFSWAAEYLGGMAAITGAFIAGLAFGRTYARHRLVDSFNLMSYSWLVPIFFVSIGLETNARALGWSGLPFALVLVVLAIVTKIVGSGLGAKLGGTTTQEAKAVGVGMVSRGEVGLIVATVGIASGMITTDAFTAVVLVVLVTTLLTPIMLRALYPTPSATPSEAS